MRVSSIMRGPLTILGTLAREFLLLCINMLQGVVAMAQRRLSWHTQEPTFADNPLVVTAHDTKTIGRHLEEDEIFSATTLQEMLGSKHSIELQLLAFMLIFSTSGLVPLLDLAFPMFVSLYIYVLSKAVFPCYPMEVAHMEKFPHNRYFHACTMLGTLLGFFFPLAFMLGSFSRGDQSAVRAATPHLFLLTSQMASELFVNGHTSFSPPCRILLTLLYSSRRLSTLAHWVVDAFSYHPLRPPVWHDSFWLWFGRGLPVINFLYCNIYMFCFLIPKFLLRAFERYIIAKRAYIAQHSEEPSRTQHLIADLEDKKRDLYHGLKDSSQEFEMRRLKGLSIGSDEKDRESGKMKTQDSLDLQSRITSGKNIKFTSKDKGKQKE